MSKLLLFDLSMFIGLGLWLLAPTGIFGIKTYKLHNTTSPYKLNGMTCYHYPRIINKKMWYEIRDNGKLLTWSIRPIKINLAG